MSPERPLASLLGGDPLPMDRALRLAAALCEALSEEHKRGRHLGAILPDQIGLRADEQVRHLSGPLSDDARDHAAPYLSPETARREPPSVAGDIYSLGAVLFALFTGRAPFLAATPAAMQIKHALEPPPSPRSLRPELGAAIEQALLRSLAKDPNDRPATAAHLGEQLTASLGVTGGGRADPSPMEATPERSVPLDRRRWLPLAAGAVLLLAAIIGIGGLTQRRSSPEQAMAPAPASITEVQKPPSAPPAPYEARKAKDATRPTEPSTPSAAPGGAREEKSTRSKKRPQRPAKVQAPRSTSAPDESRAPPPPAAQPAPPAPEAAPATPSPSPPARPRPALFAPLVLLGLVGLFAIALPFLPSRRRRAARSRSSGEPTVGAYTATLPGLPPPTSELQPFLVGRYQCFARLGEGGMGMVYKARHVDLDRISAVKVLLPQAARMEDLVVRFRREARLASSINHPNSVFIYDYGEAAAGLLYLAMEYIEGTSLAEILDPDDEPPRALPLGRVLHLARQICAALEAAHAAGIVHRDLKPQNVMVCPRPKDELVKVVDFGIARSLAPSGRITMVGAVLGTPAYMSPEQASGAADLDARSDIFSLGLLVYRMLSGALPFREEGRTPVEMIIERALLREPPPPLRIFRPNMEFGEALEATLMRALDPDREQRTPSVMQFLRELEEAA